jgi:hypothetical protein
MPKFLAEAKITLKDVIAVASVIAGALSQANIAALHLPPAIGTTLIAIGGFLLSWCRIADALDYKTNDGVNVEELQTSVAQAQVDIAAARTSEAGVKAEAAAWVNKARAEADAKVASARADILAKLTALDTPAPIADPPTPGVAP